MFNNSKLATSVKLACAFGSVMAISASNYALAQEEATTEKDAEEVVEKIQVTGSRISRVDLEATQPISYIDDSYIKDRGMTNAITAVLDLPGVIAGVTPEIGGNTAANGQALGQNTISLYGLGSQRTLTLINGSRFISSNSPVDGGGAPGGQVDVNNIPVALIDRVEVMKVGGAPVYGADAVAGVVNYILKKDYEGAEFSYDYTSLNGIAADNSFRALIGGNFAEDKGNIVVALEYNETENIAARDVPGLANDWGSFTPAAGNGVENDDGEIPANQVLLVPDPRAGILSFSGLVTPGSRARTNIGEGQWGDGNFYQFDPAGSGSLVTYNPGAATGNSVWASGGDGLNLLETNTAREGYERYNLSVIANYELAEDLNLEVTVFSNRSDAGNQGYQALQYNSGVFGGSGAALSFNTSNPYLTTDTRTQLEGLLGGEGDFYYHRGWVNLGQREIINESSVNSYRAELTSFFDVGDRTFDWALSYQKGISSVYSQDQGLNIPKFFAALDVGVNPETGQIDCLYNYTDDYEGGFVAENHGLTDSENILGAQGTCSPLNPFGTPTDASLDYIKYNDQGQTRIEQSILAGYLSGEIFDLPAGGVGFATGFERREEYAEFRPDGSAELVGLSDNSTAGGYTTQDVYAEAIIPIISSDMDIPGLHTLSVDTSYRYIDNDRSGEDSIWAVGLNYRPIEEVMVRYNITETVRAPAITELFLPVVESSQFATDPCDARNLESGPNPDVRQANCAAEGLPTDFASIAQNASRRGFTGGNDSLANEEAKSMNVGIIYTPGWAEGLDFSFDYIDIELTNAIVSFTLTDIMNACYDATDYPNRFCDQFEREADGQLPALNAFTSGYVNAALRNFKAAEYTANYKNDLTDYPLIGDYFDGDDGSLSFRFSFFKLIQDEISNTGFDFTDDHGEFDNPDLIANGQITYSVGDLTTFLDINYTDRTSRNVNQTPYQYIDQNGNPYTEIPSRTLFDFGAVYYVSEEVSVRASVQNLFDWSASPKETAVGLWSYGRTYNVGLTARF
tara:strand:- start:2653 stop:5724 length:3072 start_codon:yes stop_codon:yes gene_type:complete